MSENTGIKLAEALLLRKEYQAKVNQLLPIKTGDVFEVKAKRINVTDNVDDVVLQVPLLSVSQVTEEYDWYAKRLRQVDAAIQQANWTTEIQVPATLTEEYKSPELTRTV